MSISPPLPDPTLVGELGELVNECYELYQQYPNSLSPPVSTKITDKYIVVAYITMEDYYGKSKDRVFYGLVLSRRPYRSQFIVAIRGTDNWYEAWDDWESMNLVKYAWGPGEVGEGFLKVYSTMNPSPNAQEMAVGGSEHGSAGSQDFATAINNVCSTFLATQPQQEQPGSSAADPTYTIAGHSLGGPLGTFLAAQLSTHSYSSSIFLCTFASPMVGDKVFVNWFNNISAIKSWRLADDLDAVVYVPQDVDLRFHPINQLYQFSATDVCPGIICYHSLLTYLFYVDNKKYKLRKECVRSWDCELKMRNVAAPDFAIPRPPEERTATVIDAK